MKAFSFPGIRMVCRAYLSYSRIADEEKLEEIIVVVGHRLFRVLVVVVK